MIKNRIINLPPFIVSGVRTWISSQHNEEFAIFWRQCKEDGTSEKLMKASSDPAANHTHSRIMGISRVEQAPDNRSFDFFIATEAGYVPGCDTFSVAGGEWAVFEDDGSDSMALIRAEMEAFKHWLPSSGYVHDNRPEIEVYPEGTDVYVEFWLPVRKG